MDPLIDKFRYVSSFEKKEKNEDIINSYVNDGFVSLVPKIDVNSIYDYQNEDYLFLDDDLYLERRNKKYDHPIKYFINKDVTVLANIDAVYNLLDVNYANFIKQNNNWGFVYMVVQDNEGDFVRYVQYRKTNAYGVGITRGNNWNYQYINMKLFQPYDGYDLTGDIVTNYETFSNDTVAQIQEKYLLVLCNDSVDGKYNDREKELLYVNKFIIQCIVGLKCSSRDFVVHCYDFYSNINAQIIYLLSICFNSISIIKPLTTDVMSADKYVVCKGIKSDIDGYIRLLESAVEDIDEGLYVNNLFNNVLPDDFVAYLTEQNNDILYYQLQDYTDYNFDNLMMYLNLPDDYKQEPVNKVI